MNFAAHDNDMVVTATVTLVAAETVNHKSSHRRAGNLSGKTEKSNKNMKTCLQKEKYKIMR
jgi:hypothetical protein